MQQIQTNSPKIVILGGGYAGLMAAVRLAGKMKKSNVQITLVNGHPHFVERIRLHQLATDQPLPYRPIANFLSGTGVKFESSWATAIDPTHKQITLKNESEQQQISYDYLVYALGSTVDVKTVPGVAQYAFTLGSQQTTQKLQQALPSLVADKGQVVIVGGGLTGIEAATEIAENYPDIQVSLITRGKLGDDLSEKGATHLRHVFARLDIAVIEQMTVAEVGQSEICSQDGQTVNHDLCLWAGAFAVPDLASNSGILTDKSGQIMVDDTLRSRSHPEILAVGDAAATGLRMACATAMPMGCYAADHLAATLGANASPEPFQFGYALRCISLGRNDALIQLVHLNDTPKEKIITGRKAVWIKELICRFTMWAVGWERRFPGMYSWPKAHLNAETEQQWILSN